MPGWKPTAVADLEDMIGEKTRALDRSTSGIPELAWRRGFQTGYMVAMRDAKDGVLKEEHALSPRRSEALQKPE